MLKVTFIIFTFICLIHEGCNRNSTSYHTSKAPDISQNKDIVNADSLAEERIYDTIYSLPEIKIEANSIEEKSKGERHLSVLIYATPLETSGEYYWVKAGENNGTNFVSYFNFFVYPENFEIKFFDTLNDTIIDLETWRKSLIETNKKR